MRRTIATFLTLVMMISVFSTFAVTASALEVTKESDRFYVETSEMNNGKVTFTVYLKANQAIETAMVSAKYDPSLLTPIDDENNGAATKLDSDGNANPIVAGVYEAGKSYSVNNCYTIAYMNSTDGGYKVGTKDKAFMSMTFKVIGNAEAVTEISFFAGDYESTDLIQTISDFSLMDSPKSVSAKLEDGAVVLSWIPADVNEDNYVYKKVGNDFVKIRGWDGRTTHTDYDVENGVTYTYKISTANAAGVAGFGKVFQVTYYTSPVANLSIASTGINVTWNAVSGASTYRVYRTQATETGEWTPVEFITEVPSTRLAYVDTTGVKNVVYRYAVTAVVNSIETGIRLSGGLDYVPVISELDMPTVKISNTTTGIKVSWNTVENATGYTVYSREYNSKTKKWSGWKNRGTTKATTKAWTDKKVKSGTNYRYTVRAVNSEYGIKSSYKSTSTLKYLAPTTVSIANASNGIKVSWKKVSGATGYTVYSKEYNAKTKTWSGWKNRGTTKSTTKSWVDKKAKSGVQYKYCVRPVNGSTKAAYKETKSLMFLSQPKATVKAVSNGIKVTWGTSSGATGYTVYSREYNAKTKKWSGWKNRGTTKSTTKAWTDKKAKKGTKYQYTVRAVNKTTGAKSTYTASKTVKR